VGHWVIAKWFSRIFVITRVKKGYYGLLRIPMTLEA
jgi:hypothetical protein